MTLMDPLAGHSAVRALPVPPGLFILSRHCAGSQTLVHKFSSAHQTLNQLFVDSNAIGEADKSATLAGFQVQEHFPSLAQDMHSFRQNNKTICTQFLASISSALLNIPWEHTAALLDHHEYIYNKSWLVELYWLEEGIFF